MVSERKHKKKTSPIFIIIVLTAVILAAGGLLIIKDFSGIGISKEITVTIPEGSGTGKIASILKSEGIIKYPTVFSKAAQKAGFDKKMKSGDFTFEPGMSYIDVMTELLANGEGNIIKVTIPEGYELSQILKRLAEAGVVGEEEFSDALLKDYDYRFLKDVPERENRLEGYLFPDTYNFKKDDTGENVIKIMLDNFDKHFKDEYYSRAEEINMSVDEIVTMASIIERETNSPNERKKVAGVFYNRLKKNMRLQSCATVQYALGERKPVLSVADTRIDSPYNTYTNYGLPAGPIASPGDSCIEAALYPEDTDALYFVLDSSGNHVFSQTYEEHIAAKKNAAVKVEEN